MVRLLVIASLALLACTMTQAQAYPTKPIRIVVPYVPGGAVDAVGRIAARGLGERLSGVVVLDNKGGAQTVIGTLDVARAVPDGHTLLLTSSQFLSNLYTMKHPQYALKDFVLVGTLAQSAFALLVSQDVPADSVAQLIALARSQPGKLNWGSLGRGSGPGILTPMLMREAGLEMVEVPYKGGTPAAQALMAGDIQVYFASIGLATTAVNGAKKRARVVATTGAAPAAAFPHAPTMVESGFPSMVWNTWYAVFAPAATPPSVVARLRQTFATLSASTELSVSARQIGMEPWVNGADELATLLDRENVRTAAIFKRLKFDPE